MNVAAYRNRLWTLVGSLVFASFVCTLLLVGRVWRSHSGMHSGMLWNLFLAWLPMLFALAAHNLERRPGRAGWLWITVFAFVWLLFFPNAPYLLVDIGNLRQRPGVPL